MNVYKKIALFILSLIVLVLLFNFGLNFWVNKQLPKIISEKNTTAYNISYDDLQIDLLSKNIKASKINISPKREKNDSIKKLGIYSKIASIEIIEFKVWDILFNNRIKANNIIINNPQIILYKETKNAINNSKSLGSDVVEPFQKIIMVSSIQLNNGNLKIVHTKTSKPILSLVNLSLNLDGIVITDDLLQKKIPFSYDSYRIKTDSVYYQISDVYHLTAQDLETTNNNLTLKKFALIPEYSRRQFVNSLQKEKDLFTLQAELIKLNAMDWGIKDDKLFFNVNSIAIDQMSANIYRNKLPADDLSKKPLYNKLLRDIAFPLKIDTLNIRNSILVYEEEINFEKGPGMLTFDDFNLTATHIQSGYKQEKLPNINIAIDCKFMNNSPFKVQWNFNVLDKKDSFKFKGKINNLKMTDLSRFTKPYIRATTQGTFDQLDFTIKGNDFNSYETATLKYHDLKVTLHRKDDPQKKSKLKSWVANLIVKNDTDGKTVPAEAKVERIPEKSFFNFLWLNVAEILKQIVI